MGGMSIVRRILIRAIRSARFLPDRWAVRFLYRLILGRWPNIRAPSLFTEKLQYLKLHDRNPLYRVWADKYAVRDWIRRNIGPEVLIPCFGDFETVHELSNSWMAMPMEPTIIKASHGSHCGVYVANRFAADAEPVCRAMARHMRRDWYWHGREWPYRDLVPRILCEKWIGAPDGTPPDDYKIMCFNGRARVLQIHRKRGGAHRIDFYDMDGYKLPFGLDGHPNNGPAHVIIPLLGRMVEIAERIAAGTRYLRVDLYVVGGQVFFGEITLYDSSGFGRYTNGGDRILGELLHMGG